MDSVDINNKLNSTWVSDELDLRILQDNFCDLSSLSKCRALMNILINEREYSSVEVNKASMKEIVNLARDDQDMVCVACGILYIISMYMKFSFNGMHWVWSCMKWGKVCVEHSEFVYMTLLLYICGLSNITYIHMVHWMWVIDCVFTSCIHSQWVRISQDILAAMKSTLRSDESMLYSIISNTTTKIQAGNIYA